MNIWEKIREKIKQILGKTKKGLAIGGTIATVGLATGCGVDKEADVVDNNVKAEQEAKEDTKKVNEFKEGLQVDQSELQTLENEIDELETSDDVLNYMKNMYIEEYEKVTGDTQLTTADIKITMNEQNHIYELDNGMLVTHGQTPDVTKKAIQEDGHTYTAIEKRNPKVYTVRLKDNNEIIDAITLGKDENNDPIAVKVIPGDNYKEMKDYTSTMEKLGNVIPEGFDYMKQLDFKETEGETEFINKQCKEAKNNFIKAIKAVQSNQNDLEQSQGREVVD